MVRRGSRGRAGKARAGRTLRHPRPQKSSGSSTSVGAALPGPTRGVRRHEAPAGRCRPRAWHRTGAATSGARAPPAVTPPLPLPSARGPRRGRRGGSAAGSRVPSGRARCEWTEWVVRSTRGTSFRFVSRPRRAVTAGAPSSPAEPLPSESAAAILLIRSALRGRMEARRTPRRENCSAKSPSVRQRRFCSRHRARSPRLRAWIFDSSFSGGASPLPDRCPTSPRGNKRATRRVALACSCYAARCLARAPPSEGRTGPRRLVETPRRCGRNRRRVGARRLDVGGHLHTRSSHGR